MSDRPVRGVLLTHGTLAAGLCDAVARVAGQAAAGALTPLSNDRLDREAMRAALEEVAGDEPVIVFTDLPAGSCAFAARLVCRGGGPRGLVSGVNLPILLEFVFHRHLPIEVLIPRLVERGRDAVLGQAPSTEPR